jgi:hypothetical protein
MNVTSLGMSGNPAEGASGRVQRQCRVSRYAR